MQFGAPTVEKMVKSMELILEIHLDVPDYYLRPVQVLQTQMLKAKVHSTQLVKLELLIVYRSYLTLELTLMQKQKQEELLFIVVVILEIWNPYSR